MALAALLLLSADVSAQVATQQRWGIVVGAQDYQHLSKLRYARADATAFYRYLIDNLGFSVESTKLITDAPDSKLKPTSGNILGEIEDILASPNAGKSDFFVVYFSGHGYAVEGDDLLMPVDARPTTLARVGVSLKEVASRFANAGYENVWIVVDACRDGANNEFGRASLDWAKANNVSLFLSCKPGSVSYEHESLSGGIFTRKLLSSLDRLRESSPTVWLSELFTETEREVQEASKTLLGGIEQRPTSAFNGSRDLLLAIDLASAKRSEVLAAIMERDLDQRVRASSLLEYSKLLALQDAASSYSVAKTAYAIAPDDPDAQFLYAYACLATGVFPLALEILKPSVGVTQHSGLRLLHLYTAAFRISDSKELLDYCMSFEIHEDPYVPWYDDAALYVISLYALSNGVNYGTFEARIKNEKSRLKLGPAFSAFFDGYALPWFRSKGDPAFVYEPDGVALGKALAKLADEAPGIALIVAAMVDGKTMQESEVRALIDGSLSQTSVLHQLQLQVGIAVATDYIFEKVEKPSDAFLDDEIRDRIGKALPANLSSSDIVWLVDAVGFSYVGLGKMLRDRHVLQGDPFNDSLAKLLLDMIPETTDGLGAAWDKAFRSQAQQWLSFSGIELNTVCYTLSIVVIDLIDLRNAELMLSPEKTPEAVIELRTTLNGAFSILFRLWSEYVAFSGSSASYWQAFIELGRVTGNAHSSLAVTSKHWSPTELTATTIGRYVPEHVRMLFRILIHKDLTGFKRLAKVTRSADWLLALEDKMFEDYGSIADWLESLDIPKDVEGKDVTWINRQVENSVFSSFSDVLGFAILKSYFRVVVDHPSAFGDKAFEIYTKLWDTLEPSSYLTAALLAAPLEHFKFFALSSASLVDAAHYSGNPLLERIGARLAMPHASEEFTRVGATLLWQHLSMEAGSALFEDVKVADVKLEDFSRSSTKAFQLTRSIDPSLFYLLKGTWSIAADGTFLASYSMESATMRISGSLNSFGRLTGRFTFSVSGQKDVEGDVYARIAPNDNKLPEVWRNMPIMFHLIPDKGGYWMFIQEASADPAKVQEWVPSVVSESPLPKLDSILARSNAA